MSAVINFFRSRHLERIDYVDIIMYFQENPNCKIVTTDEDVQIYYKDVAFNFEIPFYITKRSRVTNISDISAEFVNVRIFVEIPDVIPEQVGRDILTIVGDFCNKFNFVVYYEGAPDAMEFDMMTLLSYLASNRKQVIENENAEYYTLPSEVITHVCNYQQLISFIKEKVNEDVNVDEYILLAEGGLKDAKLAVEWTAGDAQVFPPHLDYVRIVDIDGTFYCSAQNFYKVALHQTNELKNYLPDVNLLLLSARGSKKVSKKIKKLRKNAVKNPNFKEIRITNLIEN